MSDHVLPERPSRRRGGRARVARDTRLIAKLVRRSFRTSRDFGNTQGGVGTGHAPKQCE